MDDSKKQKITFIDIPLNNLTNKDERPFVEEYAKLALALFNTSSLKPLEWGVEEEETNINVFFLFDLQTIFTSVRHVKPLEDFNKIRFNTVRINVHEKNLCFTLVLRKAEFEITKKNNFSVIIDKYEESDTKKRKLNEVYLREFDQ